MTIRIYMFGGAEPPRLKERNAVQRMTQNKGEAKRRPVLPAGGEAS